VAIGTSPLIGWALAGERLALVAAFIAVLVTLRHEANIRRLVRGEEPRIAPGRKPQGPTS
jgi:glycerol-3-phosphate acyltransferase PlsY